METKTQIIKAGVVYKTCPACKGCGNGTNSAPPYQSFRTCGYCQGRGIVAVIPSDDVLIDEMLDFIPITRRPVTITISAAQPTRPTCDNCYWLIYDTDRMGAPTGAHCDNRHVPNVRWYGDSEGVDGFGCIRFQPKEDIPNE